MTDLIDTLPLSALVTVHNSLTANNVRKFENRTKAKRRILDVLKNHGGMTFEAAAANAGVVEAFPKLSDKPTPIDVFGEAAELRAGADRIEAERRAGVTVGQREPTRSCYNAAGELVSIVIPTERPEDDEHDAAAQHGREQEALTGPETDEQPRSRYNAAGELVSIVIPTERTEDDEHLDAAVARHERREAEQAQDDRKIADGLDRIVNVFTRDAPIAGGSLMMVHLTVTEIATLAGLVFNAPPGLSETTATTLLEKLRNATPATPSKPARPARAKTTNPREGGMTAAQKTITDLCQRPQGATGKELAAGCGWPSIAARTTCQKLADRFGFTLTETPKTKDRGIAFRMTPQA